MTIERIAESITELVLSHKDLQDHAYNEAEQVTGVDRAGLDSIEGTVKEKLFWAIYAEEQVRVVNQVLGKLLRYQR